MTRYNRGERIALLDEVLDALRSLLRDPSVGPRNRQSLVTSAAIVVDKIRQEEQKLTPAAAEQVSNVNPGPRIDFGAECERLDERLRDELARGDVG